MADDEYVYMWPDGDWCNPEDLEVMLTYHSDDFIKRKVEGWTAAGDPIVNGEVLL